MTSGRAVLSGITIAGADPARAAVTFETLLGVTPRSENGALVFPVGSCDLSIVEADEGSISGLVRVTLAVPSLEPHLETLNRAGLPSEVLGRIPVVAREFATGVAVAFEQREESTWTRQEIGVRVDHVALVVADLMSAVERWRLLVGNAPDEVGPHPLGESDTARFLFGDHMFELVSPWPGVGTTMRRRLDAAGDGPIAVALVPDDLPSAVSRLTSVGTKLIEQPPHVFVHPKNAGGVLVQLTPRLEHDP